MVVNVSKICCILVAPKEHFYSSDICNFYCLNGVLSFISDIDDANDDPLCSCDPWSCVCKASAGL